MTRTQAQLTRCLTMAAIVLITITLDATSFAQQRARALGSSRRVDEAALHFARGALAGCPTLGLEWFVFDPEGYGGDHIAAWQHGNDVFLRADFGGMGVEGEYGSRVLRVTLPVCTAIEVRTHWSDGFYDEDVRVDPPNTPPDIVATMLESSIFDSAAHGAASLYLSIDLRQIESDADDDGIPDYWECTEVAISSPMYRVQPWLDGRPQSSPGVYVPEQHRRVFPIDAPSRLRSAGGFELWTAPLRGRNGGFALAQYDRSADRHR